MKYLLALLGFSLIIIVHELGHFMLAKLNKVKVIEFSIGMGPKIFSYQGKETKYSLGLLPIGGYVNMLGEEEEVEAEGSFSSKSPLRRISIILAGATMNFVLAIGIYTAVISNFGYTPAVVQDLMPNGPVAMAGIEEGDKIVNINGSKIFTYTDVSINMAYAKEEPMTVKYKRDGKTYETSFTPVKAEEGNLIMGATFKRAKSDSILTSFKESFNQTASVISSTFKSFKLLLTGQANFKTDVGGPVTIIKMSAGAAEQGVWPLFNLVAFLSVSIGIMNLLPFPALDGGWTVILFIELITRRKVPEKVVNTLNTVGFMLLMGFMLLVTVKDIIFPVKF